MPFKKQPSSMTYPSAPGSDVYRNASFWSLPSLVSTPACSVQSVQTQRSKDGQGRLKVLLDYPAHSENTRVLEEADMWRADKLRVKLSAMAQACREWERALAKTAIVCGYVRNPLCCLMLTRIFRRRIMPRLRLASRLPTRLRSCKRALTRHSKLRRRRVSATGIYCLYSVYKDTWQLFSTVD